jgi:carbon monoxide dehydrogenase subunit G
LISIAEEISVPSPPDKVWAVISNPPAVVSCIQGAELGAVHDDGSFDGSLLIKFGALRVRFAAQLSLELVEAELEGRLSARGRDGQGATRFNGGATFRVAEGQDPGHSLVIMAGEVNLSGKLASLIESGAGAVVARMTKEFSAQLIERCAAPAGSLQPPVTAEPGGEPATAPSRPSTKTRAATGGTSTGSARRLTRWRAWWTRLLRGRQARPAERSASAQPRPEEEASSGSNKAQ